MRYFSLPNQGAHDASNPLWGNGGIHAMLVIKIYTLHPKPLEGSFHCFPDRLGTRIDNQ